MIRFLAANESMQWIVYAVGALTIVYVVLRPSFRKKDPLGQSAPKLGMAQQRSVEREMSNLLVELSEMARQITGQLDTRSAKLELLIKQADERLAHLADLATAAPMEKLPLSRHADVPPAPLVDPRHVEVYVLADQGHTA